MECTPHPPIAAYDAGGNLVDSTRLQMQGVLDDLFTYSGDLGLTYSSGAPTFRLWATTARAVTFHRFADRDPATSSTNCAHERRSRHRRQSLTGGGAVEVTVTGSDGYVSGWIDWDGSGAYGDAAGEEIFTNELVEAGQSRIVSFGIPAGTSLSQSLSARFRVYDAPQTRAAPAPTGGAGPGEVEDFIWSSTPTAVTAGSVVVGTGRSPAPLLALLLLALLSVGAIAGRRAARPR